MSGRAGRAYQGLVGAVALLALAAPGIEAKAPAGVFDTPLSTQIVKLPADPENPEAKPQRTCSVYPGFMVKEVDLGEKGAAKLAVLRFKGPAPSCDDKNKHEQVISPDEWSGYFDGAKGGFVFFDADDGLNGGMPFAVWSAETGKRLFSDSRQGDAFASVNVTGKALVLRYRRVLLASCSLYARSEACWGKIAAATGLAAAARPDCTAAYDREIQRAVKFTPQYAKKIPDLASIIAYDVEARYASGKLSFKPLPGKVECWLED